MGTFENRIKNKADKLGWTTIILASVASKCGIRGASEASLSKAFANTKELSTHETALPLDQLLTRFLAMAERFEPFALNLRDPDQAKQLLEDFESGALIVSVTRQEPGSLVYSVFVIEGEPNKLFQGIVNGESRWGVQGTPIKDRIVADGGIRALNDMGHRCRVLSIRMRTTETKIARALTDLGFVFQEKDNGTD
jgi:hypothetical protein